MRMKSCWAKSRAFKSFNKHHVLCEGIWEIFTTNGGLQSKECLPYMDQRDTIVYQVWHSKKQMVWCENFFKVLFLDFTPTAGDGTFAVIGDNLGSHIRFITLPINLTHFCQPFDVAVFAPMKQVWRSLLEKWQRESRSKGTLPKEHFPLLLSRLVERAKDANIVSGFRAMGIYPQNREAVLKYVSYQWQFE